jgi:two-component system chemotaxis sensor kinase CheA
MDKDQAAFLQELLADFRLEAAEHHHTVVHGLLALEKSTGSQDNKATIETVFREIHSLKGAARAVNLLDIERLCQAMESVFHKLKLEQTVLTPVLIDTLMKGSGILEIMIKEIGKSDPQVRPSDILQFIQEFEISSQGHKETGLQVPSPPVFQTVTNMPKPPAPKDMAHEALMSDSVRISTAKLDTLLKQVEEFIPMKSALGFLTSEVKSKPGIVDTNLAKELTRFQQLFFRSVDDLLFDIRDTLLMPFGSLLGLMPRIARDISKVSGKEVTMEITGEETEIDRRILEQIKDPLIHLIRNCIDHGIEPVEKRKEKKKNPAGLIRIGVVRENARWIRLTISDDGAGINVLRVSEAALKAGICSPEQLKTLNDSDICALIFKSGLSTNQFITDFSGRGLGMAIVAEKISLLGGSISIETEAGIGTTFHIELPVTLTSFKGIVVRISDHQFAIPVVSVMAVVRTGREGTITVGTRQVITYKNEHIPVFRLDDILDIAGTPHRFDQAKTFTVLFLKNNQRNFALIVDEVNFEIEGLARDMGSQLVHVRHISGVTLDGTGKVIPILNVAELAETASVKTFSLPDSAMVDEVDSPPVPLQILIAEDSLTSRSLLRNIVESGGFRVSTAVDGMDAFRQLQQERFDLVVSDVEMPGMDGFELTRKIRATEGLSAVPVILVTALSSPEDRQRGMDVGANAYIVKSNFEQSNLLDTINLLI